MKKEFKKSRSGFTLVEMLIVVGVLAVLIGLLAPAILKNIKIAQRKKNANERAVLQAAIVEFWHDQSKWPIKEGDKPEKAKGYKITYDADNYEVFNQLVKADFGGRTKIKNYIDPTRHITTARAETAYPAFSAVPLEDVLEGRNGVSRRANPALVYWGDFIKCPNCPSSSGAEQYSDIDATECGNNKCTYYETNGTRYRFEPGDRKASVRGLRPLKVTFDMLNNLVSVSE